MRIFKILLFTPLLLLLFATGAMAQSFGQFASGVFFNINGAPATFNTTGSGSNQVGPGRPDFDGDLGTFNQGSGDLKLNGGEMKTFKDNGTNVCGAFLNYSIHPFGTPPTSFSEISLTYKAGCSNGTFDDGLGGCSGNDQKWSKNSDNIDLTRLCAGTYVINVFYRIPGSASNPSSCDQNVFVGSANNPAGTMIFTIESTLPAPAIQGASSVCPGATAQLTADNCTGTLTWSNGATGTSINAPAGTYTATCTNADGCVSPPSAPFTVTETVVTAPTITGPSQLCQDATGTITASGCSGTVTWSTGETGESITVPPGASYTATCTVNGCTSPASDPLFIREVIPSAPTSIFGDEGIRHQIHHGSVRLEKWFLSDQGRPERQIGYSKSVEGLE